MALVEVAPGDSVSQASELVNAFNFDFTNFDVSKYLLSPEQYLVVGREFGGQQAVGLLEFCKSQQNLIHRCISVQAGSIKSASGSEASRASSGVASRGSSLHAARFAAARKLACEKRSRKVVPRGLCYTKMLKQSASESVAARLGEWPSLASLLKTPYSSFQSLDELQRFRLVGNGESVHVEAGGVEGFPLLPAVSRVASSFSYPQGSFGAVLKADGRGCREKSFVKLNPRTFVGGLRVVDGAARLDVGVPVDAVELLKRKCGYFASSKSDVVRSLDADVLETLRRHDLLLVRGLEQKKVVQSVCFEYGYEHAVVKTLEEAQGVSRPSVGLVRLMGEDDYSDEEMVLALTRHSVSFVYYPHVPGDSLYTAISDVAVDELLPEPFVKSESRRFAIVAAQFGMRRSRMTSYPWTFSDVSKQCPSSELRIKSVRVHEPGGGEWSVDVAYKGSTFFGFVSRDGVVRIPQDADGVMPQGLAGPAEVVDSYVSSELIGLVCSSG